MAKMEQEQERAEMQVAIEAQVAARTEETAAQTSSNANAVSHAIIKQLEGAIWGYRRSSRENPQE